MTLLIEATTAYLGPLLKKHWAGQAIVWDDLVASHVSSLAVLRIQSNNPFVLVFRAILRSIPDSDQTPSQDQIKYLYKLHQSQVKAYREAAIQSNNEWFLSLPLQPMEEGDTKDTFVDRCILAVEQITVPNWKLPNTKATAINEIRKRANATYEKYHPIEEDGEEEVAEEEEADEAEGSGETGDEISEDDGDEDNGEVGPAGAMDIDVTTKTKQPAQSARPNPNRNKRKGGNNNNNNNNKNTTVRKKPTAKGGYRNKGGPANRGGRGRGGRGGNTRNNNSSN